MFAAVNSHLYALIILIPLVLLLFKNRGPSSDPTQWLGPMAREQAASSLPWKDEVEVRKEIPMEELGRTFFEIGSYGITKSQFKAWGFDITREIDCYDDLDRNVRVFYQKKVSNA